MRISKIDALLTGGYEVNREESSNIYTVLQKGLHKIVVPLTDYLRYLYKIKGLLSEDEYRKMAIRYEVDRIKCMYGGN